MRIFPTFRPPKPWPWWLRLRLWFVKPHIVDGYRYRVWRKRIYVDKAP